MRLIHRLAPGHPETVAHRSGRYLSLFDVATYPSFVGPETDHLDLEVHLMYQREALVGLSWLVPDLPLEINLILALDGRPLEELFAVGHDLALDGSIRTLTGHLGLASEERLHAAARQRDLSPSQRVPGTARTRTIVVPPGTYAVHLTGASVNQEAGTARQTVVLRHYPFPAPRVAPVRLNGEFLVGR